MAYLSLLTGRDVQRQFAEAVRSRRRSQKLSRSALAERSTVPASTIKRFETTADISLRQFLLLWQSLDRLEPLAALCEVEQDGPRTIDEVLAQ